MPRIAARLLATKLLAAAAILPVAAVALTPTPAQADGYRGYGGYYRGGYGYYHRGFGPGAIVGGALLGIGVGALLAAPYVAPPPVVYAPPPAYYPAPAYAYAPPAYYAPPPYYYGR